MRRLLTLVFVFAAPAARAQTPEVIEKTGAILYILRLQDKDTGAFKVEPKGKPSLRATSGAVRALHYLMADERMQGTIAPGKVKEFVLSCYDAKTGGFAEPDGKPDVATTSVGVMGAVELGIPEEKFPKAVQFLRENAKTFEDVRIGAAALEALKKKPDWIADWFKIADAQLREDGTAGEGDGVARETASVIAMKLRLGFPEKSLVNSNKMDDVLQAGQWKDGGYGKAGAKGSDLESTYRVMRAFMLMKERPKDRVGLRAFVGKCRNEDGGSGTKPGEPSTMSGTYYAAAILMWLDAMEK